MGRNSVSIKGLPDVDRVMRHLRKAAAEVLKAEGDGLLGSAKRRWPRRNRRKYYWIKRPHSATLFRVEFKQEGNRVSYAIHNEARDGAFGTGDNRYQYMISTVKNGVIGNAWQLLIRRPVRAAVKRTARELTEAAQEALRHGS